MSKDEAARDATIPGAAGGRNVLAEAQWQTLAEKLQLSERQLQIIQRMFDDSSEARIALDLGISEHTVHTHIERLYRKLGVSSRCELLVRVFGEFRHPSRDT